jgi:hypothetical protein
LNHGPKPIDYYVVGSTSQIDKQYKSTNTGYLGTLEKFESDRWREGKSKQGALVESTARTNASPHSLSTVLLDLMGLHVSMD